MIAKKYKKTALLAKPHKKNAPNALPTAMTRMIEGYENRSHMWPMITWPTTEAMLNVDNTAVAVSWFERSLVNVAMYRETGKYDRPCMRFVKACRESQLIQKLRELTCSRSSRRCRC